ncbi:MAG: hypothetical protein IKG21_08450 [Atopobiaceae bacterium]|nr:hypothetical protein [Atopobiaceae bacterium]
MQHIAARTPRTPASTGHLRADSTTSEDTYHGQAGTSMSKDANHARVNTRSRADADRRQKLAGALVDAGCNAALVERCKNALNAGNTEACIQLLRAHRCDLVEAMHQAQHPIDVCDWIIQEVKTSYS